MNRDGRQSGRSILGLGSMSARVLVAGILISPLLILGCQKPPPPPAPTLATVPGLTNYSLQLVDRITGAPVVGARIHPYCGIPGDTNRYRTDQKGLVEF